MAARSRLTIRSIDPDPRATALRDGARHLGLPDVGLVGVADVVFFDLQLDADARQKLHGILVDPLLQHGSWEIPSGMAVEITRLPGVTDSDATAVRRAAAQLDVEIGGAATGTRVEFDPDVEPSAAMELIGRLVANPVVERWVVGPIDPASPPDGDTASRAATVPLRGLDDDGLGVVNVDRALSLDVEELRVIRDHFSAEGRDPTDVELETLAQTWSEHCAHKTFRARIQISDGAGRADDQPDESPTTAPNDPTSSTRANGSTNAAGLAATDRRNEPTTADANEDETETREPLLDQLRRCTEGLDAPFVRSAFVGNAGVVEFAAGTTLALKAETHNHPSAIEPFGGANTGVGGVIRDVLGMAHRPIAVTDVLCFGLPDLPLDDLPAGALHPQRIRAGVIDGVADYGNKIGLPTVAGAILYDAAYTTNPLVFAGCIGTADTRPVHDGPFAGDRVVLVGGATGRDGIRGATFSSATMDATTGEVAGASVQIGDPIIEKLLIDALVGAEDLYSAITDCGAGGLSSAIGEMAEGIGADVELELVPRKYPGLEPWEVWLSEAQERMVLAVPPRNLGAVEQRCRKAGVEMTDLGTFTGNGRLVVRSGGTVVANLDTAFLHDGRPQRTMRAVLPNPQRAATGARPIERPDEILLRLLAHPNIASKAATIHQYDHEIRGCTVVRPLLGAAGDGPADGVVLAEPDAQGGIAIGLGVNPWYGLHDPEAMAHAAVDEAIRNVVAVGADPDRVALLDNFSWGDPRRPSTLGELVAAVDGCCAAAYMYGAPFVSGKDSLNNEYVGSDGRRHAVPPTLVVTAVAHVPDADRCVTPDLSEPGNVLLLLGHTAPEFAGSHLDMILPPPDAPAVAPAPDPDAPNRYRRLHAAIRAGLIESCHDVSEGGLAVALAEMCIAGRLGATIERLPDPDPATSLFAESAGRLVVEVTPERVAAFLKVMDDQALRLGQVNQSGTLKLPGLPVLAVADLADAFNEGATR